MKKKKGLIDYKKFLEDYQNLQYVSSNFLEILLKRIHNKNINELIEFPIR